MIRGCLIHDRGSPFCLEERIVSECAFFEESDYQTSKMEL